MSDELKIKISSKEANQKLDTLKDKLTKITKTKHKAVIDVDTAGASKKISVLQKELKKLQNQTAQSDRAKKTVEQKGPVVNKELEQLKKSNREYDKLHKKKIVDSKKFTQDQIKQTDTITARRLKNQRDMDAALKKTDKTWSASEENIRRSLRKTTDQHKKRLKDLKFALKGDPLSKKDHGTYARAFDDFEKKKEQARKKDLNHEKNLYASRKGGIDLVAMANQKRQKEIDKSEGWFRKRMTGIQDYFNNKGPLKNQKPSAMTVAVKELTKTIKTKNKIDTKATKQATKQAKVSKKSTAASKKAKTPTITKTSAGKPDIMNQLPQNAMLGRFAQFGMMASGMAATLFLFQMIAAQLVNLMNVITTWEESLLKLIDSFKLTDEATAKLPNMIREYARSMGTSSTDMAQAVGAAMEYGMSPTKENTNQLYKLNYSDNTKTYKDAALVMALAGTEFGDRAMSQFSKKWDAYSGEGNGEKSGSFGHEWERLKGAGKDAMIQVFSESDAQYGQKLTDSMRGLSDWITANRFAINDFFDSMVNGLKSIFKVLKLVAPALIAFAGIFLVTNSMKLFLWTLTSMSKLLGPLSFGLVKTTAAMEALTGTKAIALATLTGWIPALISVGVAIGGWAIYKKVKELKKLKSVMEDIQKFSSKDYASMTEEERQTTGNKYASSEQALMISLDRKKKILQSYQNTFNSSKSNRYDKSIANANISSIQVVIDEMSKKLNAIKSEIRDVAQAEAKELGLVLPANVASVENWINGLQRVNQELGYMPDQLKTINEKQRGLELPGLTAAVGPGQENVLRLKKNFEDSLRNDPAKKQKYDLALNQASIDAGGFNQADRMMFMFKEIQKTQDFVLPEGIKVFAKIFETFSAQSATIEISKFQNSLKQLDTTVEQLDLTSFQKKLENIRKERVGDGDKNSAIGRETEILTNRLSKQYKKWRSENVNLKGQKEDINASNLSDKQKMDMKNHLDYLDQAGKLQYRLTLQEKKGFEIKTDYHVKLEQKAKQAELDDRWLNLGKGTEKNYNYETKENQRYTDYTLDLNKQKRLQIGGQAESLGMGSISDMEKEANIQARYLEYEERLNKEVKALNKTDREHTLSLALKAIAREEEIKQIESLINKYSEYDRLTHGGMSKETEAAKRKLIAENAKDMESKGIDSTGYSRAASFDVEQEKLAGSITAWGTYYDIKGGMTAEHYKNEQTIITENYNRNLGIMKPAMAKMIQLEEEYQNKLKNRKNLSFSEDMAVGVEEAQRKIRASYQTTGEIVEITMVNAFDGVSDAMADWVTGAKNAKDAFKDMARSVVNDLIKMIIKQEMFNMAKSMSSSNVGWISAIGSLFASEHGNVVSGIGAYSNQIVNKPTIVPQASRLTAYAMGGALFGEKGPEAIMPLTRMSSGNLGVETNGGSGGSAPNVEINITNNGENVKATQDKEPKFDGEKWVIGIVLDHTSNNKGNFRSSMKGMLSA